MVAVAETGVVAVVHGRRGCCCRFLTNVSCLKKLPDNYRHYLPSNNPFQDSDDLIPAELYLLGTITELSR
jgi:hypothetical protein